MLKGYSHEQGMQVYKLEITSIAPLRRGGEYRNILFYYSACLLFTTWALNNKKT